MWVDFGACPCAIKLHLPCVYFWCHTMYSLSLSLTRTGWEQGYTLYTSPNQKWLKLTFLCLDFHKYNNQSPYRAELATCWYKSKPWMMQLLLFTCNQQHYNCHSNSHHSNCSNQRRWCWDSPNRPRRFCRYGEFIIRTVLSCDLRAFFFPACVPKGKSELTSLQHAKLIVNLLWELHETM